MLLFLREEILACCRPRLDAIILFGDKAGRFAKALLAPARRRMHNLCQRLIPPWHQVLETLYDGAQGAYEPAPYCAVNPGSVQGIRKSWCRVGTDTFECNRLPVDVA